MFKVNQIETIDRKKPIYAKLSNTILLRENITFMYEKVYLKECVLTDRERYLIKKGIITDHIQLYLIREKERERKASAEKHFREKKVEIKAIPTEKKIIPIAKTLTLNMKPELRNKVKAIVFNTTAKSNGIVKKTIQRKDDTKRVATEKDSIILGYNVNKHNLKNLYTK